MPVTNVKIIPGHGTSGGLLAMLQHAGNQSNKYSSLDQHLKPLSPLTTGGKRKKKSITKRSKKKGKKKSKKKSKKKKSTKRNTKRSKKKTKYK